MAEYMDLTPAEGADLIGVIHRVPYGELQYRLKVVEGVLEQLNLSAQLPHGVNFTAAQRVQILRSILLIPSDELPLRDMTMQDVLNVLNTMAASDESEASFSVEQRFQLLLAVAQTPCEALNGLARDIPEAVSSIRACTPHVFPVLLAFVRASSDECDYLVAHLNQGLLTDASAESVATTMGDWTAMDAATKLDFARLAALGAPQALLHEILSAGDDQGEHACNCIKLYQKGHLHELPHDLELRILDNYIFMNAGERTALMQCIDGINAGNAFRTVALLPERESREAHFQSLAAAIHAGLLNGVGRGEENGLVSAWLLLPRAQAALILEFMRAHPALASLKTILRQPNPIDYIERVRQDDLIRCSGFYAYDETPTLKRMAHHLNNSRVLSPAMRLALYTKDAHGYTALNRINRALISYRREPQPRSLTETDMRVEIADTELWNQRVYWKRPARVRPERRPADNRALVAAAAWHLIAMQTPQPDLLGARQEKALLALTQSDPRKELLNAVTYVPPLPPAPAPVDADEDGLSPLQRVLTWSYNVFTPSSLWPTQPRRRAYSVPFDLQNTTGL